MSAKKDYDFIVEYAKSDRSKCNTTKDMIPKGDMRIGQMVQSPKFDGKIPVWYVHRNHVNSALGLHSF